MVWIFIFLNPVKMSQISFIIRSHQRVPFSSLRDLFSGFYKPIRFVLDISLLRVFLKIFYGYLRVMASKIFIYSSDTMVPFEINVCKLKRKGDIITFKI